MEIEVPKLTSPIVPSRPGIKPPVSGDLCMIHVRDRYLLAEVDMVCERVYACWADFVVEVNYRSILLLTRSWFDIGIGKFIGHTWASIEDSHKDLDRFFKLA